MYFILHNSQVHRLRRFSIFYNFIFNRVGQEMSLVSQIGKTKSISPFISRVGFKRKRSLAITKKV